MSKLIGGPDLRARLASLQDVGPEFGSVWATKTAAQMLATAPNPRRPASRRFTTKVGGVGRIRAAVYGAYWWIFVDRGTKAHDIFGSGGKNPPDTLRFPVRGQTIFAKKVHHPRTARQPFATKAAQDNLNGAPWIDTVIKRWNGRRTTGHSSFL